MPPVNILIKPASSLCNMRCKYCFYADVSDNRAVKSYGMMNEETLENLVKRVFEYATGYAVFSFQGGEPTMVGIDFYKCLLALQSKYNTKRINVSNSIQTNGYIIDAEWAEFLAKNKFLVGLSMDGTRDIHNSLRIDASGKGTYGKAELAAQLFRKYGVEFNILCVVNNFVARHPKKVYDTLKGYKYIQFIPCLDDFDGEKTEYSLTNDKYAKFLTTVFEEYYNDFISGNYVSVRNFDNYISILLGSAPENCAMRGMCTCYFVVEGDGSVFPCDFYVLDEWYLGNLNNDSFDSMIKSQRALDFVNGSLGKPDECRECKFFRLCRGGCRREREPFVDGSLSQNRLCEAYKAFFSASYGKMIDIAKRLIREEI